MSFSIGMFFLCKRISSNRYPQVIKYIWSDNGNINILQCFNSSKLLRYTHTAGQFAYLHTRVHTYRLKNDGQLI